MTQFKLIGVFTVLILTAVTAAIFAADSPAIVQREFIYDTAPFRSCHASTIAETPAGLVCAWFGGTSEGRDDVGIWLSRHAGGQWLDPVEVANGKTPERQFPCWNPALYQAPDGPLVLFYKVGPNPDTWWGVRMTSSDDGRSWSPPERLPDGQLGPIKNKPIRLDNGDLLCPSSTEHDGWRVHIERTGDLGKTWTKTPPLNDGRQVEAIQPTIVRHADGQLQFFCRTRQKRIYESWSRDGGQAWSELAPTALPNPSSGIDATNLLDGRIALIYNHTERHRSPLNVAVSTDGRAWQAAARLESTLGEFSYPALICTRDGLLHATYTWQRLRIRHVVLDPAKFEPRNIVDGQWPE